MSFLLSAWWIAGWESPRINFIGNWWSFMKRRCLFPFWRSLVDGLTRKNKCCQKEGVIVRYCYLIMPIVIHNKIKSPPLLPHHNMYSPPSLYTSFWVERLNLHVSVVRHVKVDKHSSKLNYWDLDQSSVSIIWASVKWLCSKWDMYYEGWGGMILGKHMNIHDQPKNA